MSPPEEAVAEESMQPANRFYSLLALAALGSAPDAQARVVSSSTNGFVIENSAIVPTDERTSWRALVDDVGRWWPADHTWFGRSENLHIDARAGGCFCEI